MGFVSGRPAARIFSMQLSLVHVFFISDFDRRRIGEDMFVDLELEQFEYE